MISYRTGPETERLSLREFRVEDAEAFFQLRSDPQVIRFTGDEPLQSLNQARKAIEDYPDFETVGFGRWACVLKETQETIGFCGLKYLSDLQEVDLGYRLLPRYWCRGLATEASRACVEFGFEVLKLDEIIALVLRQNKPSIRVLEKVGMRYSNMVRHHGHEAMRFVIRI